MSADLSEQLSAYGSLHRDAQAPITLAEVAADRELVEVETTPPDEPNRGPGRRWLAGLSAAAVLALIVVGVVAVRSGGGDPEDLETSDVTVAERAPAAEPSEQEPEPSVATPAQPVVPADAVAEPVGGVMQPTFETPLPDFDGAVEGDDGPVSRPLPVLDAAPVSDRLDFLRSFCLSGVCARDAVLIAPDGTDAAWFSGQPFHIRHGFVNEHDEPLPDGFDLAVYVFPMEDDGGGAADEERVASGPTQRFRTDYVVREESDACGPTQPAQSGTVTCESFVHEFDEGLPAGRWALWAVWEAPCTAWVDLGITDRCDDPDEVQSFFSSGVDSPVEGVTPAGTDEPTNTTASARATVAGEPTVTEVDGWTRVDGLGIDRVFSDGTTFYGITVGPERKVVRSDDGIEWDVLFEAAWWDADEPLPAVRDGRLVAVDADGATGTPITVHLVEPDGSYRQQEIALEGPPGYEPFLRGGERPSVNILENGRIVINTRYVADQGLVRAAAPALLADRFGVADEDVVVTDLPSATGVVEVLVAGAPHEITVADLGLEPWWEFPREVAIVLHDGLDDGSTWNQLDGPEDVNLGQVEAIQGGLVAYSEPRVVGSASPSRFLVSTDGVTWTPLDAVNAGPLIIFPLGGSSTQNRSFFHDSGSIWELTAGGLVPVVDRTTAPELLDVIPAMRSSAILTVGDAAAVHVDVDVESDSERGIWYSIDEYQTWMFERFPDSYGVGGWPAVGASAAVLIEFDESQGTAVWVRDLSP